MILGFKKKINGKPTNFPEKILSFSKKHTIREDKPNRWKQGRMIQFVTRGKSFSCEKFAEMPCLGIQKIEIKHNVPRFNGNLGLMVYVDGFALSDSQVYELSKNDGFDDIVDFLAWFNKDFEGKIIHWTNHVRY